MIKKILILLTIFYQLFTFSAYAAEDPLAVPNNPIGIHILNPSELESAKKLVNSNGGDWGYVTIPIQYGDRNLEKWQAFMDAARRDHLIPLMRLATDAYWENTTVWRKPNASDVLDFANFLDSLSWPTKNKYVILFNEVNRFDEWGGEAPNPGEYAELVSYARDVFKARNQNFYLILGGMDAAAPTNAQYINGFTYLERMRNYPGFTFSMVDGFSSHAYPNPDFSAPPQESKKVGVATYRFEFDIINTGLARTIPAFITETGWNAHKLPGSVIAAYYKIAIEKIWSKDKDKIVAITPFVLSGEGGAFDKFSFLKGGNATSAYTAFESFAKIEGSPAKDSVSVASNATASVGKVLAPNNVEVLEPNNASVLPEKLSYLVNGYFKTMFGIQ